MAIDLIGVLGLAALVVGLWMLRTSDQLGFDVGQAAAGVASQLSVTLPAAAIVVAACGLELAAGLILARLARRDPFASLAEAGIAAFVALVLKDAFVLGLLGGFGLFRAPVLVAIDASLLVSAWRGPLARRARPLVRRGAWGWPWGGLGSIPLAALVTAVWLGPVVLQLASPVVPFIDVLPNHVAPAEHLRTFGWLTPLSATFSPIYGPSRSGLGYEGLLGSVATITGLPATLALAAFILPSTLLVAAGVQRLAAALAGPGRAVGPWALLAFALTEPFARLGDARATVVVLPLVALALALAAEAFRGSVEPDRWRPGRGLAMGAAMGASVLVHPVIGAFAIASVAILALARPQRIAADALVAGVVAAVVALPQAAIMVGVAVPPLVLPAAVALAIAGGAIGATAVASRPRLPAWIVALARAARLVVVVALALGLGWAGAAGVLRLDRLPDGLAYGWGLVLDACGVLLLGLVLGWLVRSPAARSPILLAAAIVGLVAAAATQLLPNDLGFLGDALRFEVPKTVHYWLPAMLAVAVGPSLARAIASHDPPSGMPWTASVGAVAVIVALSAAPLRTGPIDTLHLGEHRYSESLAIDLRWAARGFWTGFPDSRLILDPSRRAIADAIRGEIDAGRIRDDTPVLHVAASFQQWVSTPLGVFDGVVETFVSPNPEVSQQTVGGRLHGMLDLRGLIDSGLYPYVVLEPNGLPGGTEIGGALLEAGYRSIFENGQGQVFVRGS
ncbi:MAG TPA: hypothetical protein VJ506_09455 [Candidatus Limnocylindrales bacterium]|nr:hypothetical protein [Candidatus Limnocylindrales bacterium]